MKASPRSVFTLVSMACALSLLPGCRCPDLCALPESQSIAFGAMGETEDANTANDQGVISEEVNLGVISGSEIILPDTLDVKLVGYYSGCSIDQTAEVITD